MKFHPILVISKLGNTWIFCFSSVILPLLTMSHAAKVAQKFATLLETEKDWEKRVIAMQKMEESLKTDFGLELTQKDILLFRPALCAQITDNRTAVAKQACEFTTTLVRFSLFEPENGDISPVLDRQTLLTLYGMNSLVLFSNVLTLLF